MTPIRHALLRAAVTTFGALALAAPRAGAQGGTPTSTALEQGFRTPPDAAKPRVWWHWMNGNVTKEGITADLEWMKRVGIGGFQMFDGGLGVPQFTEQRLVWMTPEWKDAFRHAGAEADRLRLEMAMAASGGWSETGGPWVTPEQAMKKVVWSETEVRGPRRFSGVLPKPPSSNGPFQNVPPQPGFEIPEPTNLPGAKPPVPHPPAPPDPTFYADTRVIAVRVPEREVRMPDRHPRMTSSAGTLNLAAFTDGDLRASVDLPYPEAGKQAWVQFEFAEPFRAQAFTFAAPPGPPFFAAPIPRGVLQASQDGKRWTTLDSLPGRGHPLQGAFMVRTYAFPPTTARYFRVLMERPAPNPMAAAFGLPQSTKVAITELELHAGPRVNRWQDKAQYGNTIDYGPSVATPATNEAVAVADVVDLTARLKPDGTLDWQVPTGRWTVLRLGYSLTGRRNHPATREATGFEVDKLNRAHVTAYAKAYSDMVSGAMGPAFGKGFRYFLMDSWEAGLENWTDDMIDQFRARRGYDPTPYLPVLTGRVIGSAEANDRFLWDFRRTIADLLAENHYAAAAEYFRTRGVGLYAEAMGAGLPTTGDGLQDKGRVDIPMGEFWTPAPGTADTPDHASDPREAASAAHIYGKPIVAAESFTTCTPASVWSSPSYLKPLGDRAMALGINRFVIHTSDHQPFVDDRHKPGITLGPCGIHYTRNNTWAEQSAAFNTYLARGSYLLQQGVFVADVAYFYGEGAPITVPFWKPLEPAPPAGYSYDWVNAEVLLTRAAVRDGRLVLPGGMSYRVLVLPADVDQLTVPMLHKLRDLVAAGAVVVAPKPKGSPSLSGGTAADAEARALADTVWGGIDGRSVTEHAYGKGKVYWGQPVEAVLAAQNTPPDVRYDARYDVRSTPSQADGAPIDTARADSAVVWIHRRTADADIYFVANQRDRAADITISFRAEGKAPELWHPDTGEIEPAAYQMENGRTTVPLRLDPYGSVFVVFRRAATAPSRALPTVTRRTLTTVAGPWAVTFPPDWGAPPQLRLDSLMSWTAHPEAGVKYFSGTATYTKDIDAPQAWFKPGARIVLDLGAVKEIAEVSVNGKPLGGVLWKPPYTADVTGALRPGRNRLEVKVTNLWVNRVLGDQQPSATRRYAFLGFPQLSKDMPLRESGLIGPVRLDAVTETRAARVSTGQE
jgi:hypothetical protein